jgi:hypothetical protein
MLELQNYGDILKKALSAGLPVNNVTLETGRPLLTYKALMTAGWLAMASAFVSLPLAFISFRLAGRVDATANLIQTAMQVVGTLLFVAIVLFLRKLLNTHFSFHDTDRNIDLMIKASVVAGALTVMSLFIAPLKDTLAIAVIIILVLQGLVQVQFGYRLLRLPNSLGGMLQPFCYVNMATGILIASVVLILVGVLVSAISDLMLGTIFFTIARQVKEAGPAEAEF